MFLIKQKARAQMRAQAYRFTQSNKKSGEQI
jgi:hypothetical protein